jgi:hypothetical protein
MGLKINEKTKYMTTRINKHQPKQFEIEKLSFEIVQSFTYLGSLLDVNNDNSVEIRKRMLLANKCFYGLKRQFRSQFLSIKNKVKLYKTLMKPVLAYGAETWALSKSDENILKVFERKILRTIFGPTNEKGEWRIKYNNELYTLYKECDIVTYIKINRLRWAGHVIRLEEQNPARRVLVAVVEGRRKRGRPKLRWKDGVKEDARKLGERNWRNAARNRDSWQKLQKKALARNGLLCR